MREHRFETFSKKRPLRRRQYYFRYRAANGEIMLQSEGYNNQDDRDHAIRVIRGHASVARVVAVQS